jgi:hypothetical protein
MGWMEKVLQLFRKKRCGIDIDHEWGAGRDEQSANDMTFTCLRCRRRTTAPHGFPPSPRD